MRDIAFGVVDGIAQYGNALGVPTYGGETYFDASFDDNCLVNVVAFGIVEEGGIIRSRVPEEARECAMCGADLRALRPWSQRLGSETLQRD